MKIEWQVSDIIPARIVGSPSKLERWMIGYVNGCAKDNNWVLVSLSDGMVSEATNAQTVATKLNDAEEIPLEFFDEKMTKRGRNGGHARAAKLTPQRRSQIASEAANARWHEQQEKLP